MAKDEETALVHAESDGEAASNIVSLTSKMNTHQLKQATERMTKQREIITSFVNGNLKEGVDFGVIESTSKSGREFKSKPTLFKPGMEKIFSLFGITTELEKDAETLDMLKDQKNLVAFKCSVYKNGVKIAEGRGAASIGDMSRDANATIKIAEKRARMDACLSLGFSEFFTQDMDDPEYRNRSSNTTVPVRGQSNAVASPKQKNYIMKLLRERLNLNRTEDMLLTIRSTINTEPKEMTMQQASDLIEKLQNGEVKPVYDIENEDLSRGPGDPDVHGYPGQDDEITDEQIATDLAEAEAKLLGEDNE